MNIRVKRADFVICFEELAEKKNVSTVLCTSRAVYNLCMQAPSAFHFSAEYEF